MKVSLFLTTFLLFSTFSHASISDDARDMEVSCAIINGKINNASRCNELQKKKLEGMCQNSDPNACKALKVAKEGKDEIGMAELKINEQKTTSAKQALPKKINKKKVQKQGEQK
jgi:hypothetical protein